MENRFKHFFFILGHSGISVPEWKFRPPVQGRISESELVQAWGSDSLGPEGIFLELEAAIKEAAGRKIEDSNGTFEEPVTVTAADL